MVNKTNNLFLQAENTFLLALDGDVDFTPGAVRLLLDRMRKNSRVGASCGRIHPIGSGTYSQIRFTFIIYKNTYTYFRFINRLCNIFTSILMCCIVNRVCILNLVTIQ